MPQFRAEIPETFTRITRPVAKQILNDVLKRYKDFPFREFRMRGDTDNLLTPGSAIDADKTRRATSDTYVDVDIDDIPFDEYTRSFQATANSNHYIFRCPKTRIDFYPVYQTRKITFTFKVVSNSRVRLNGLVTRMTEAMRQSQTTFTHEVSYNYDLPVACTALLQMFYNYISNNYPYDGLTYEKWISDASIRGLEYGKLLNGKSEGLMFRENAVNISSNLTEAEAEAVKTSDDNNGVWNISFDLEVIFQRPSSIRASYPCMVHNQVIPIDWCNVSKAYDYTDFKSTASITERAAQRWMYNQGWNVPGAGGLGIKEPAFDDWSVEVTNKYMIPIATCMVVIDEGDPTYLFDPSVDMIDYTLPESFLRLMRLNPKALFYSGMSFFFMRAYNWGNPIAPEHLKCADNSLKVNMEYELNFRDFYHVIICLNGDPTTIPQSLWQKALQDPEAVLMYFTALGYGNIIADAIRDILKDLIPNPDGTYTFEIPQIVVDNAIHQMFDDGVPLSNSKIPWGRSKPRHGFVYDVIGES